MSNSEIQRYSVLPWDSYSTSTSENDNGPWVRYAAHAAKVAALEAELEGASIDYAQAYQLLQRELERLKELLDLAYEWMGVDVSGDELEWAKARVLAALAPDAGKEKHGAR